MGGVEAFFGPIPYTTDPPVFHTPWERRAFGLSMVALAVLGNNLDAFRASMERLDRDRYLAGYYHRWIAAVEDTLEARGHLAPGELDARVEGRAPEQTGTAAALIPRLFWRTAIRFAALKQPGIAYRVQNAVLGPQRRAAPPRFAVGDAVRTHTELDSAHTRLPRYARGKRGTVTALHGGMILPDEHAEGRTRGVQLYGVAFEGPELWGPDADPEVRVHIDLFETYLEAA